MNLHLFVALLTFALCALPAAATEQVDAKYECRLDTRFNYLADCKIRVATVYTVVEVDEQRQKAESRLKEIEEKIIKSLSFTEQSASKDMIDRLSAQEALLENQALRMEQLERRIKELESQTGAK